MAKTRGLDDFCIQVTNGFKTRKKAFEETVNFRRMYDESRVPYRIKMKKDGKKGSGSWYLYIKADSKPDSNPNK